jgi:hypothetical protein
LQSYFNANPKNRVSVRGLPRFRFLWAHRFVDLDPNPQGLSVETNALNPSGAKIAFLQWENWAKNCSFEKVKKRLTFMISMKSCHILKQNESPQRFINKILKISFRKHLKAFKISKSSKIDFFTKNG